MQLKRPSGEVVRDPPGILNTFLEFYETMYQTQPRHTDQELYFYLENLTLPSLNQEDSTALEHPITQEEICDAISSFKPGKPPGLDGFPADWYQLHKEKLAPSLQKVFIAVEKEGILPDSGSDCGDPKTWERSTRM